MDLVPNIWLHFYIFLSAFYITILFTIVLFLEISTYQDNKELKVAWIFYIFVLY